MVGEVRAKANAAAARARPNQVIPGVGALAGTMPQAKAKASIVVPTMRTTMTMPALMPENIMEKELLD